MGSTPCKRTEHTCVSDGYCVGYLRRCDGENDCDDGSDEYLCQGQQFDLRFFFM